MNDFIIFTKIQPDTVMATVFYIPESTHTELQKILRATTSSVREAFRSKIILFAAEGRSYSSIAQALMTTVSTVRKWVNRFIKDPSLKSLVDARRSGRPHIIPSEAKCEVVKFACSDVLKEAPETGNVWTIKALQNRIENSTGVTISKSEISRILNDDALRPHKVKMWLHSPDPLFKEKTNAIASLYLNQPPDAIILCIDEKTGMQAIERKRSLAPKHKGCGVRMDSEYRRHGTQTLIACFDVRTGKVYGECGKTRKMTDLVSFMEKIAKLYPTQKVFIIWDNLNTHCSSYWVEFNKKHGDRFDFVYTPKHGSWLNQIEIWFGILQRKKLKNGSFTSEEELRTAVVKFIKKWNEEECHPFRWQFRGYIKKAA